MRRVVRPCMESPLPAVSGRRSVYADDITVPRRMNILAVKAAVDRYEKVADAKINFDKRGLRLGAWRGRVPSTRVLLE